MGLLWEVVGGAASGGIIVRKGYDLSSPVASGGRLATGSLVGELQLHGERLHFLRLTGAGPDEGWVSVRHSQSSLLVLTDRRLSLEEYSEWSAEELRLCREVGCSPEALGEALGYLEVDQDDFSSSLTRRIRAVQLAKYAAPTTLMTAAPTQPPPPQHVKEDGALPAAVPGAPSQHKEAGAACCGQSCVGNKEATPVPREGPAPASPRVASPVAVTEEPRRAGGGGGGGVAHHPHVLPVQEFEVAHDSLEVREKPSLESLAITTKVKGQHLFGVKETFDGWVKLDGEFGWIPRHLYGWGATLMPVGSGVLLARTEVAEAPGPQLFEVVSAPHVDVHAAPSKTAEVQGTRRRRDVVQADVQTYNGWVKLSSNGGWILGVDPEGGPVLRGTTAEKQRVLHLTRAHLLDACARRKPNEMDSAISQARAVGITEEEIDDAVFAEPPEWRQKCSTAQGWLSYAQARGVDRDEMLHTAWNKIDQAAADEDPRALWDAVLHARMYGFGGEAFVHDAEVALREMRRKGASHTARERRQLQKRIAQAKAANNMRDLRECVDTCCEAGFHEEWVMAADMLAQLTQARTHAKSLKDEALDKLAAATASGDAAATRAAKEAAKAAGATKREISRAYALHCG